ncbi:MAG: SGNH/GDSL hydrolase family protein [Lachnospiraceae bacterium]|nr:SGNH/GDSL hydrolase family protein [Lachnospiraceae bacterium]
MKSREDHGRINHILLLLFKTVLAVLLFTVLNRVFMPKYVSENPDGHITEDFYKEKLPLDVIFVGSSTVYSAVSPPVLWERQGFASYDRGNASQPMWISYYMIEDAFKSGRKPELVALDVGFIKYDDNFVEEPSNRKALDGMRLSRVKLDAVKAAKGEDEKVIDYIFPILRFHTRWKELSLEDFEYVFRNAYVDHNGYLINYNVTDSLPERDGPRYMNEDIEISKRNREYLLKIIELCRDNGTGLFLMKVPSYSNNWGYHFDDQIREIAEPYGIDYVNFDESADEIGLDYNIDSPDNGNHLNTYGAEKFSAYLADYLKAHYELSSHKEDEKYRKVWDEKLERYEADKKTGMGSAGPDGC